MKVGVGDVDKTSIRRDVGGRREHPEACVLYRRVAASAKLPERTFRTSVALRNVNEFLVWRHSDTMRAVDVHGHQPNPRLALDSRATRTEANQDELVGGFTDHINQIVLRV